MIRSGLRLFAVALCAAASSAPAAESPRCVVDRSLYCFQLHPQPRLQWVHDGVAFTREPAHLGGHIVAAHGAGLHAYDADGQLRWQNSFGDAFRPVLQDGNLFASSLTGVVARLNLHTGAEIWRQQHEGWHYPPAVFDDRIVTGGQAGTLIALRIDDGAELWQRTLTQELVYRPVAAGPEQLLVSTFDGALEKYTIDGERAWRRELGVPATSPQVHDGIAYSSLLDRRVVAIRIDNGASVWQQTFSTLLQLRLIDGQLFGFNDDQVMRIERETSTTWRTNAGSVIDVVPANDNHIAVIARRSRGAPFATLLREDTLRLAVGNR